MLALIIPRLSASTGPNLAGSRQIVYEIEYSIIICSLRFTYEGSRDYAMNPIHVSMNQPHSLIHVYLEDFSVQQNCHIAEELPRRGRAFIAS